MTDYDFVIARHRVTGLREVEDAKGRPVATLHPLVAEAIFVSGASALGLSVYDRDAGHGLCGTLDQTMRSEG